MHAETHKEKKEFCIMSSLRKREALTERLSSKSKGAEKRERKRSRSPGLLAALVARCLLLVLSPKHTSSFLLEFRNKKPLPLPPSLPCRKAKAARSKSSSPWLPLSAPPLSASPLFGSHFWRRVRG